LKVLIVSQVFWPDNVAVSLFISDLAEKLVEKGHHVQVIAGRFDYEDQSIKYPLREEHKGIEIIRLKNSGSGKNNTLFRLYDFFTFNFKALIKLMFLPKLSFDLVICSTVPPMLPYITSLFSKRIAHRFFYWAMDLQPELSIVSGMITKNSIAARLLERMSNRVFHKADHVFALDIYMKKHIEAKLGHNHTVSVTPLWPVIDKSCEGSREDNPFRREHGFGNKIVVMYSGNHSFVHPLGDLLQVAMNLRHHPQFIFVFIGSGVRKKEVSEFREKHALDNIVQLPFQPRESTHISLGAADFQVVVLGNGQVGYTHPNKIYGALFLGKPIMYIGPHPSHISDILNSCPGNISGGHGEWQKLMEGLIQLTSDPLKMQLTGRINKEYAERYLSPELLKNQLVDKIESL
jgi:colanic acid biosynthesis glycosyl transferase WcaI